MFGVEISDLAVKQIFEEADLSPKLIPVDSNSTLYEACKVLSSVSWPVITMF